MTFAPTFDNPAHYLDMYVSGSMIEYLTGDWTRFGSSLNHAIAYGASVTIDVALLLDALNEGSGVVKFVMCDSIAWSGAGSAGTIKLTNITVETIAPKTTEEKAMDILAD